MCHIENFAIKKQSNGKFLVEWNAINADKVTINGRDVTGQNRFIATVKDSQMILLRVDNTTSFDVKEVNVVYDSQTIYGNISNKCSYYYSPYSIHNNFSLFSPLCISIGGPQL